MSKIIDLTGQIFGRLTVLKFSHMDNFHNAMWECQCSCDNKTIKIINGTALRRGHTKSCSCLQKETMSIITRKQYGESAFNSILDSYKRHAHNRDLNFELTKEQFRYLIKQNCYYCDNSLNNNWRTLRGYGNFIYNGIDRLDNNKGYILENCVTCCKICNIAKQQMGIKEFYDWIERIYNKRVKR